ncbi:hypothetical protein V8G54_029204 [Vigna mungo]|uniref:Uncharacterized protein n=1 Tax=Vigna mungo TaxID=3915 RepID=A0AAQ3RIY3_VIGMU
MQKRKLEDKVIDGSKIEGGGGHGGNSHGNGNSGSSDTRGGGAAVIPVYAAGAANKNNQHQTRHESEKMVHCIFCNNCYRFFEGIVFGDLAMHLQRPSTFENLYQNERFARSMWTERAGLTELYAYRKL